MNIISSSSNSSSILEVCKAYDSIHQLHHVEGTNNHDERVAVDQLPNENWLKMAAIGMKMLNYLIFFDHRKFVATHICVDRKIAMTPLSSHRRIVFDHHQSLLLTVRFPRVIRLVRALILEVTSF